MLLSESGKMIENVLVNIPDVYDGIYPDTYVIMPNHVHAVLRFCHHSDDNKQNLISLSELVKRFKTFTTNRYINGVKQNNWPPFHKKIWQRSFYDHVIRNEMSLNNIRDYIINNPVNWDKDEENMNRLD